MNKELSTAIVVAIVGILGSFLVTNMLFEKPEDFVISSVDKNLTIKVAEPDEEIFNYLSVNPTVEVYVGECEEYDEKTGECIEKGGSSSGSIINDSTLPTDSSDSSDSSNSSEIFDGEPENDDKETQENP